MTKIIQRKPSCKKEHHLQAGLQIKHTLSRASQVAHQQFEGCASDNAGALPLM